MSALPEREGAWWRGRLTRRIASLIAVVAILVVAFSMPGMIGPFPLTTLSLVVVYAVVTLGFDLLMGHCGQVSLAQPAFLAAGAFAVAQAQAHGFDIWLALLFACAGSAVVSVVTGLVSLRLAEFYFALVTVGLIVAVQQILTANPGISGGSFGMPVQPVSFLNTSPDPFWNQYFSLIVVAAVGCLIIAGITRSPLGRAFNAIRDGEVAAAASGVPVTRTKVVAFVISGIFGCVGGAFYVGVIGFAVPNDFGFTMLILFLGITVLGGRARLLGPIIGSAIFVYLPPQLQATDSAQNLIFGLAIIVIILFAPAGVAGMLARLAGWVFARPRPHQARTAIMPAAPGRPVRVVTPSRPAPSESTPTVLRVDHLSKSFGGIPALVDVTLEVAKGEVLGLIGPNGSGKTTLINCVNGMYAPSSGRIELNGTPTAGWRADRLAAAGVRRTFQSPHLIGDRSVLDNVLLGSLACSDDGPVRESLRELTRPGYRRARRAEAMTILRLLGLDALADRPASRLAGPVRKVVELARSVMGEPQIVLLDEVASGMSSAEKTKLVGSIHRLCDELALTLVVIEHDLDFVSAVVSRVAALNAGRLVTTGAPADVFDNPDVREAYVGA